MPEPKLSSAQFAKLQKQWYAKLANEGFEDIEWVDHSTGKGHNSGFLKNSMISGRAYHAGRDLYYQLASNYLLHGQALSRRPYYKFIWKLHSEGRTYQEIADAVKRKYKNAPRISKIFYQIKHLAKLCYKWNSVHPEGLLRKRQEDKVALEESGLAEFYGNEYNWIINEQFALQESKNAKAKKTSR